MFGKKANKAFGVRQLVQERTQMWFGWLEMLCPGDYGWRSSVCDQHPAMPGVPAVWMRWRHVWMWRLLSAWVLEACRLNTITARRSRTRRCTVRASPAALVTGLQHPKLFFQVCLGFPGRRDNFLCMPRLSKVTEHFIILLLDHREFDQSPPPQKISWILLPEKTGSTPVTHRRKSDQSYSCRKFNLFQHKIWPVSHLHQKLLLFIFYIKI